MIAGQRPVGLLAAQVLEFPDGVGCFLGERHGIFRLDDGLVVEHWAVRDDATLLDSVDA